MVWTIIKLLCLLGFLVLAYKLLKAQQIKMQYEKQGVVFSGPLAVINDNFLLMAQLASNPFELPFVPFLKKALNVENLPPYTGACVFGDVSVYFSNPDDLQDLYFHKNSAYTKHWTERAFGAPLMENNIASMETEHPLYAKKRKALSSAFFKNRVQKMVNMVKETTLQQFALLQAKGEKVTVNLAHYTQVIQSHIIMNISCGRGQSTKELKYLREDGQTEDIQLATYVENMYWDLLKRISGSPLSLFFPALNHYQITASDKRYFRNVGVLRDHLRKVVKERQVKNLNDDQDVDMISILVQDPSYKDDVESIVDDIVVMFMAGSKTVHSTTTNLITRLIERPEILDKIRAEMKPVFDRCQDDLMRLLTTDEVDELEYLKMCYTETLRSDAPAGQSSTSCFNQDVTVGKLKIQKGAPIFIAIQEMHNNKDEWIEPFNFIPERFDPKSKYFKRPDGSNRNPLVLNPFLGGKRICLGKTFAETTLKLVLPLYFHHFEFEFDKEEHRQKRPHVEIGGDTLIDIPVNFITRNKVKQDFMQPKQESGPEKEM